MDVGGGWLTPVVIPGAPPIKMDQQLPFAVDFLYGGNTDQGWILSVHCLELHASFKLTNTCIAIRGFQLRLKKKKKKKKKKYNVVSILSITMYTPPLGYIRPYLQHVKLSIHNANSA